MYLAARTACPMPWAKKATGKPGSLPILPILAEAAGDVLLVSACDKLHNARAILSDLRVYGPAVFSRFTAGREGTLWYYEQLSAVFLGRMPGPLANELARTVAEIQRLAG